MTALNVNTDPPTDDEVWDAIIKLKDGKAPGTDLIMAEMLKADPSTAVAFLGPLIRKVWKEEQMPTDWRTGLLVTVPKKGDVSESVEPIAVITLRPTRTQERKKVVWTEDTVDNENMNKKKSKCCCIYEKPLGFGESDSETSDDECEHCSGHVEKRKHKHQHQHQHQHEQASASSATTTEVQNAEPPEPTATIALKPGEPSAPPDKLAS